MNAASDFRLDEVAHAYYRGLSRIPGTTEILKGNGLIQSEWYNAYALERGRAVHAACHYLAEGELNFDTLDPTLKGYVEAYEKALEQMDFTPIECEKVLLHETYNYGTKPDQVGIIGRFTLPMENHAVVELKSGTMPWWASIQTAFQTMARFPTKFYNVRRFCFELHEDGTFKVEEFTDPNDFEKAVALLTVFNLKLEKGEKVYAR